MNTRGQASRVFTNRIKGLLGKPPRGKVQYGKTVPGKGGIGAFFQKIGKATRRRLGKKK